MTFDLDPIEAALVSPIVVYGDSTVTATIPELVAAGLEPTDFDSRKNQTLWLKTIEWCEEGNFTREKAISYCLESDTFGQSKEDRSMWLYKLSKFGYLEDMRKHAADLIERRMAREIKAKASSLPDGSADSMLKKLESDVIEMRSQMFSLNRNSATVEGWIELEAHIESIRQGRKPMVPSGVKVWDEIVGGKPKSQSVILAARPGLGKTSLAEQIIEAALIKGEPVLYIQMEIAPWRALGRIISKASGVSWSKAEHGNMSPDEIRRFEIKRAEYMKTPIHIEQASRIQPAALGTIISSYHRRFGTNLVVVDYIQLINCPRGMERRIAIGEASRSLKLAANDTGCTVLCLAQLNRTTDRDKTKPNMSDLKESGDLEADADVILALWPAEDTENKSRYLVNWSLLKNRNGEKGTDTVMFDGPSMSYVGISKRSIQE